MNIKATFRKTEQSMKTEFRATQKIDLGNYYTKEEVDKKIADIKVTNDSELPIIFSTTLTEATTKILITQDMNGNSFSLTEWDIFLHVPGSTTYATPFYIYAINGDAIGFHNNFIPNDNTAPNVARFRTIGNNFTEKYITKYDTPKGDIIKYYANGVTSYKIGFYTYDAEKPFPIGTYLEVRGR